MASTRARAERQRCLILRQYRTGRTRLVCRKHNWSTRWVDNVNALFLLTQHEQTATRREGHAHE